MTTGTGHWPRGARGLAIPTYFTHQTKPFNLKTIFNTYFESSRATPGNHS